MTRDSTQTRGLPGYPVSSVTLKMSKPIGNVPLRGTVTILQGFYADEGHVIPAQDITVSANHLIEALNAMLLIAKGDLA